MYKLMLVEDEIEVLEAMLNTIQWEEMGFSKPVGARNGNDAISKIQEGFAPHVIITDIYMPFLNGLELAKYAKEHLPDTIVVILSGYDDFSYAQKAVEYNVYKYLLKPVTPKKMKEILRELKIDLDQHNQKNEGSKKIMQDHFLQKLVTQKLSPSVVAQQLKEHNLVFSGSHHLVISLDADIAEPDNIDRRNSLDLARYGLLNISKELLEKKEHAHVFLSYGIIKIINSAPSKIQCEQLATDFLEEIVSTIKTQLNFSASGGIGQVVTKIEGLHTSDAQSLEALSMRFFYGSSSVTLYNSENRVNKKPFNFDSYITAMVTAIQAFDKKSAQEVAVSMFDNLMDEKVGASSADYAAQRLLAQIFSTVSRYVDRSDFAELEEHLHTFNFSSIFSLEELKNAVISIILRVFEPLDRISSNPTTLQMIKAEDFIHKNYADPSLSLNTITDHLAVSTSYFSTNFKSRTGLTFVEYLTDVRMNQAKNILGLTNQRTYEIASAVGYSDPHYFSSSFKKRVGMSPKQYREKMQEVGGLSNE